MPERGLGKHQRCQAGRISKTQAAIPFASPRMLAHPAVKAPWKLKPDQACAHLGGVAKPLLPDDPWAVVAPLLLRERPRPKAAPA